MPGSRSLVRSTKGLPVLVIALAMLVGGGLGCSKPNVAYELTAEGQSLELRVSELEGLSFVPGGRTFLGSALIVGSAGDLLVDRYEVRRELWEAWDIERDPIPEAFRPIRSRVDLRPSPEAWTQGVPAVGMTLDEARAFAGTRGLRLLTSEEWLWCAVGPTCRRWPSGTRQRGFANTLDAELLRATPVGAFESGQTPETAIYDMRGNVWEWVEPPSQRLRQWHVRNEGAWPGGPPMAAPTWVLGGSFRTPDAPIYTRDSRLLAMALTTGHRSSEVGLRCCAGAEEYLTALPVDWGTFSPAQRDRLEAVGARWGVRATGLLEDLVESRPRSDWLLALQSGARASSHR